MAIPTGKSFSGEEGEGDVDIEVFVEFMFLFTSIDYYNYYF